MSSPVESPAIAPPAAEPCPTPLEWRVVLEEFRRQARPFTAPDDFGGTVRGLTFGSGAPLYVAGPAVGNHELFALLAWLLKEDYCCVFVEPPTIRWPVKSQTELPRQSGAVLAAARHLGHTVVSLLGVGFGASLALDVCLNQPERVNALIVLQGTPRLSASLLERGLNTYGGILPGTMKSIPGWSGLQRQNHRAWFPPFDGSRFDFLVQNLASTSTAQHARRMTVWSDLDFRPQLGNIRTPLLLVSTEGQGALASLGMEELRVGVPHAQSESLHSAGLHPYLTHPHRLAKLIRTFIDGVRTASAH